MIPNSKPPNGKSKYDQRLEDLLVAFFRSTNIPFIIVENPHFQKVLHYLNPNIDLPQFTSIFKVATANHAKNAIQEKQKVRNKILAKIGKESSSVVPLASAVPFSSEPICSLPLNLSEPPNVSVLDTFKDNGNPQQSWPCMICMKTMDWRKTRTMRHNDAPFLLLICVKEGVFSLEVAQRMYAMRTLKCCFDHLKSIYTAALRVFGVGSPEESYQLDTYRLREPYYLVQKIKDASYEENPRDPKIGAFKNSLKCFLTNYQPRNGDYSLSHLVGLPPRKPRTEPRKRRATDPATSAQTQPVSLEKPSSYTAPPSFYCQMIPAKKRFQTSSSSSESQSLQPESSNVPINNSIGQPRPGEFDFPEEFLEIPESPCSQNSVESGSQPGVYYFEPIQNDDYHITDL